MKVIIQNTFYGNLQRVRDLTQLHLAVQAFPGQNNILYSEDVLRASVVLMHATLEDTLRGLFKWKIPDRPDNWDDIPLKGCSTRNQPNKFLFGNLKDYKDLTVLEVLKQSVDEYLNYTNYNKIEDICNLFRKVGVESSLFTETFSLLEQMIARRHNIVHKADREAQLGSTEIELSQITYTQVISWIENMDRFGNILFSNV